jgi:hypothetical protein
MDMFMHRLARRLTGALLLVIASSPTAALAQGEMEGMVHVQAGPLGISMERMGSGTTWIPDAAPIPTQNWMLGSWHVMAHGVATLQYDWQGGPRGDDEVGSLNWLMVMASRDLAGGRIQPRLMLSLEAATVGGDGYPVLMQTGELYKGNPIRDRQHPHDFWMELGVVYERELTPGLGVSLYGAASGEPALGPVAFMHRPSAVENPFAPLSHHWQDATHISYGVATAGLFGRRWKLEGSWFNAHEPDEDRWNFDAIDLNSYSGRLTVNPAAGLSLTAGFGRLDSPESLHPDHSVHRLAASVLYSRANESSRWTSAAVFGMNRPLASADADEAEGQPTSAVTVETSISEGATTVLGRVEYVEKSAEELVIPPSAGVLPERVFGIGSFSMGLIRDLGTLWGLRVGVGGIGTMYLIDEALEPFYGARNPRGGMVFLRVRPRGNPIMTM